MSKPVILTGIRANSDLTLGNYLGAVLPMVELAREKAGEYQLNMFVPDLHSFTTPVEHEKLASNIIANLKLFVAAGLPIERDDVYIYRQSYIPAHSELAWILSCFTGFGEASRMVEFKDKQSRLGDGQVTVGLFNYPILMAADILLYGAQWVPVGEDQRQHIELARTLAERLNNKFGDLFVVPKSLAEQQKFVEREAAPRIRSLRNPEQKMSKSIDDPSGTILLSDKPDDAAKKIMSATTDSKGSITYDFADQPGISNLLQILALLRKESVQETAEEWKGRTNYGELKQAVAAEVTDFLQTLHNDLDQIDTDSLNHKLESSELLMREVAEQRLGQVQRALGLR